MTGKTLKAKLVFLFAVCWLSTPALSSQGAAQRPEIFVQMGHTGQVFSAAFSPDGKYIVSGGDDHTIKIWDAATGRELRKFACHDSNVRAVAFSPDGKKIISASWDKSIRLWDIETGREIMSLNGHNMMVNAVVFSSDGRFALSGSIDDKMKLWDVSSGREMRTFSGHAGIVYAVALSPDGKYALSGCHDKTMRLWDAETGLQIKSFNIHEDLVSAVAFSPDGKHALSGSFDGAIVLWDIASGKPRKAFTGHENPISSVVFSPDGRYVLSGSGDKTVRLWDVASGKEIKKFSGHQGAVRCVDFSADGRYALSASADRTLILWNIASGRKVKVFKGYANFVECAAVSPDGAYALSGDHGSATLRLWELSTGRLRREFKGLAYGVIFADFLPDGKSVLAGNGEGIFKIWNIETGAEEKTSGGHTMVVDAFAMSTDKKKIISGDRNGVIILRDVVSGAKISEFKNQKWVGSLAFSPDGRYAAAGCDNNLLKLLHLATGKEELVFKGHERPVSAVAFSPDGKHLLSGSGDRTMKLWDIAAGKEVKTFLGHKSSVNAAVFSTDGKIIVSAGGDEVKIWDVSTGRELKTFAGHSSNVEDVVLSADGKKILSAGWDGALKVWETSSGRELAQFTGFSNGEWIAITPEGYYNSSKDGHNHLNIRQGMKVYVIDQFYDVFYRPDILQAKLRGEEIAGLVTLTIDEALRNPPPEVAFTAFPSATGAEKVKVGYTVKSTGGGIGEIRLFHNGKLIQSDGYYRDMARDAGEKTKLIAMNGRSIYENIRGVNLRMKKDTGQIVSKSKEDYFSGYVEIDAVSGENEVSISAFNRYNNVQSIMKTAAFKSLKPADLPSLYVLCVGIDEYRLWTINLRYAVKDARDFAGRIAEQSATLFRKDAVHIETVFNEKATKKNIKAKVAELAAKMKPADSFVLFIAAHGVLLENQYYIVTSDYDGKAAAGNLISSNEIVDFSKSIKSLSQLMIFDTCHAGGVDYIVSGLYDARMSVLAKKMGLHIYASASSKQEAMDGYKGNGLFSYHLIDGLNNNRKADSNQDHRISVIELGAYAKKQTEETSARIGHRQTPLIINFGKDAVLYNLRD